MMQTISGYMAATYGTNTMLGSIDAFKQRRINPNSTLATRKHEFMCDCLWWTRTNKNRMLEAVNITDFTHQLTDEGRKAAYERLANEVAERIIEESREVWALKYPDIVTATYKYDTKLLCAGYLLADKTIPCDRPWQLIMTCQTQPKLGSMLKAGMRYASNRPTWQRKDYYEKKLKPEAESILETLQNPELRETYLQAAEALLAVNEPD